MKKAILILAVVFLAAGCGGSREIATVNGVKITEADFKNEMESLPPQYKSLAESPDMKRAILDNLVMTELLIQHAEKEGILSDPDVQKRIKEQVIGIKSEADQQIAVLKEQKESAERIAEREVVIKEVLEGNDFSSAKVDEKAVKNQYDEYVNRLKTQNPGAKPESYDKVKGDIRQSVARQAWLESLKKDAKITTDESFIGQEMNMPSFEQGQIEAQPPSGGSK